MKSPLLLSLVIVFSVFAANNVYSIEKNDSLSITKLKTEITQVNERLSGIQDKLSAQEDVNAQTISNISTQLDAASTNITIFGILFSVAAIFLGVYVTVIERKIVKIKEENTCLLNETTKNKEEVVAINNLIQKDIYGLYLKIKREETCHILKRLVLIPKDITNLDTQLLSRDLEKEDFETLKKAYLKLLALPKEPGESEYPESKYEYIYKVLFFQHFLDLSMKDEIIANQLINFYPNAIICAFENDIIKSTNDFIRVVIEYGYNTMTREINSYIKGLSKSKYKDFEVIYKIMFDGLQNRESQFGFFNVISDKKECRVGKFNYGKLLMSVYSTKGLSSIETLAIEKIRSIKAELDQEETK